ncbi:MAG: chromate resistance protein [Burkholderiales bacterium]|nr:chromate resistance protein [Burkholderiales bacterium]
MDASITVPQLSQRLASGVPPALLDVRREADYAADAFIIRHAVRRRPDDAAAWATRLELWRTHVVYCADGQQVSQAMAEQLRNAGLKAAYLEGGIEAWREAGGTVTGKQVASRWITRERPKIDRIACPWLIRRFIDPDAKILFAPTEQVFAVAEKEGATPFDIPGAVYSHAGELCSFDTFIAKHRLASPALAAMALIVRGADTARLDIAGEAAGLLAVSLGLSRLFTDDHEMLHYGLLVYDALYAWCVEARGERHNWQPQR